MNPTCDFCPFRKNNICFHPLNKRSRGKVLSPKFFPKAPAWCKRKIIVK